MGNGITDYGIEILNTSSNQVITNNNIKDAYGDGIYLNATMPDSIVSTNSVFSSGGSGIRVYSANVTKTSILGNTLKSNSGYGIEINTSASGLIVSNNTMSGNTSGSFSGGDHTTNNIYANNNTQGDTNILSLNYFPATSQTFSSDLIRLTFDGTDANSFTGNGLHFIVDQSQTTGYLTLAEDDNGIDLHWLDKTGGAYFAGSVGIGDSTPASLFTVGSGDLFQINSSGIIASIDGVAHIIDDVGGNLTLSSNSSTISLNDNVTFAGTTTLNSLSYTWPGSHVSSGILQNNGSGTLSWTSLAAAGIVSGSGTDNYLTRFNSAGTGIENGTLVDNASSGLSLSIDANNNVGIGGTAAGTTPAVFAGFNRNVGIGTTSPDSRLHVKGGDAYIAPESGYTFDNPSANEDLYVYGNMEVDGLAYLATLYLAGTQVTSSATEINILDGATISTAELNYLDGASVTNGGVVFGDGTKFTQDATTFFWNNSSKRLGIGTTAPSTSLDLFGTTAGLQMTYDANNYGKFTIGSDGTLTLAGVSGGGGLTNIARFSSTNVSFDVPTAFTSSGDVSIANDLYFTNQTASYLKTNAPFTLQVGEAWESNDLTLETYNAGNLILKSSNLWADGTNVGIGTTSPGGALDVFSSSYPVIRGVRSTAFTNDYKSVFTAMHQTSGDMVDGFGVDFSFQIRDNAGVDNEIANLAAVRDGADNNGKLYFATRTGGVKDVKMTILNGGNVGIGTTSPASKLDVNGTAWLRGTGTSGLFVNSSGNVGIGTTAPGYKLQIANSGTGSTTEVSNFSLIDTGTSGTSRRISNSDWKSNSTVSGGTGSSGLRLRQWNDVDTNNNMTSQMRLWSSSDSESTYQVGGLDIYPSNYWSSSKRAAFLYSSNVPLAFTTVSTATSLTGENDLSEAQMILTTSGKVGIGTTAPLSALQVIDSNTSGALPSITAGTQPAAFKVTSASTSLDFGRLNASPWTHWMQARSDTASTSYPIALNPLGGNVGIGTTNPSYKLDVSDFIRSYSSTQNIGVNVHYTGTSGRSYSILSCYNCGSAGLGGLEVYDSTAGAARAYIAAGVNGWQTPSDRRLKSDIATLSVLDKLDLIRGTSYTLDDSGQKQIGVIAQEIREAFPHAVTGSEGTDSYLGVSYDAIATIALQGVKELSNKVRPITSVNNNVGIGINDPGSYRLYVSGAEAYCDQDTCWNDASDISFKTNIRDIDYGLEEILALKAHRYIFTKTGKDTFGLIAQEVENIIPEVVSGVEGHKGIAYGSLTPVLIKAIQEQQLMISAQNHKLGSLESSISLDEQGLVLGAENTIVVKSDPTSIIFDRREISDLDRRLSAIENIIETKTDGSVVDDLAARISGLEGLVATASMFAMLDHINIEDASMSSHIARVIEDTQIFIEKDIVAEADLTILGKTNVSDLGVTGNITAGLLSIRGFDDTLATPSATVATIGGPLRIQPDGVERITLSGDRVEIDEEGNLIVRAGDLLVQKGTIKGSAQIRGIDLRVPSNANTFEVLFDTEKASDEYAVTVSQSWVTTYGVIEKRTDGFKVRFGTPAPDGATMDWIIIE